MIRLRPIACLLLGLLALPAFAAEQGTETIVILRHGEKPAQGLGQLSCQGLNRALALPDVLLRRYGAPTALFAPNPAVKKEDRGVAYPYIRPLATIEPLAIRAGKPVNLDWGMREVAPLASHLLAQRQGTYVVAWEHHYGEQLARALLAALDSADSVPEWDNRDFDSLYVIRIRTLADGARQAGFSREAQGLNGLPEACSAGAR